MENRYEELVEALEQEGIKALARDLALTRAWGWQTKVAEELGVSQPTIGRLKNEGKMGMHLARRIVARYPDLAGLIWGGDAAQEKRAAV